MKRTTGQIVRVGSGDDAHSAFVPAPLPPDPPLNRAAASAFRVHEYLQKKPITGIREMEKDLGLTYPTVAGALDRMKKLRIVKELTGFRRNRVFAYAPYVELLSEGTEPIR